MKNEDTNSHVRRERQVVLALVRAGLWEREPVETVDLALSDEGWNNVYRLARQQTVTGLAFEGLRHWPERLCPPEPLLLRWAAEADAIERGNRKMDQAITQLYAAFRQEGLAPVLQKGQGAARHYAKPQARVCGDIDLYFPTPQAGESARLYLWLNLTRMDRQADGSLHYRWQGVDVEHHPRLLDVHNPFLRRFVRRLEEEKGYSQFALAASPDAPISVPSPFLELLSLNLHILKHALGRGIGLRQLCDMARACYRLCPEVDTREMERVCRKMGLTHWCALLHAFLRDCLGLPAACLPYAATASTAQPLADIVWRGGNFGQYDDFLLARATGWQRKRQTALSFGRNLRFAFRYAPKETFWFFLQLMKGQMK